MKVKQINNIQIYQIQIYQNQHLFQCRVAGKVMEEFATLPAAEKWCRETKDFLGPKTKTHYIQSLSVPAKMILAGKKSEVQDLVVFLVSYLRKDETLEIYPWTGHKWYIEVNDSRLRKVCKGAYSALAMRIGFTFDIQTGKILWNCQQGNCWVRA